MDVECLLTFCSNANILIQLDKNPQELGKAARLIHVLHSASFDSHKQKCFTVIYDNQRDTVQPEVGDIRRTKKYFIYVMTLLKGSNDIFHKWFIMFLIKFVFSNSTK